MKTALRPFRTTIYVSLMLSVVLLTADSNPDKEKDRVQTIIQDNQISTAMNNSGSFSGPGLQENDLVWHELGYSYEINFFIGAEVEVAPDSHEDAFEEDGVWKAHIISDGLLGNGGELAPDGSERWGWQPLSRLDDNSLLLFEETSPAIPYSLDQDLDGNGKIDSWPEEWLEQGWPNLWPGHKEITGAEYIYAMDDRHNKEFAYYPFPEDTSRRGLGLQVVSRTLAYSAPETENALITIYDISNISDKDLLTTQAGLWGDPHIGGADDWRDDWIVYDSENQVVFVRDDDGISSNGLTPGYMGIVFLQTPGNDRDGLDNDGDGMIDESQYDGIDNDNDWDSRYDDVGADGMVNTGDEGEGDGLPTPGEPHFETRDMDEVDMVGLKALPIPLFSEARISNDEQIWQLLRPGRIDTQQTAGDYALMPASGYFPLEKGQSKRMTVAIVFGRDHQELLNNVSDLRGYYQRYLGNYSPVRSFTVALDDSTRTFTDSVPLVWEADSLQGVDSLALFYSTLGNRYWFKTGTILSNNGHFIVDTGELPSSVFYRFRLETAGDAPFYRAQTDSFFTIDNSGAANETPELIWDLADGLKISGHHTLRWRDGDVDGDRLSRQLIIESGIICDTLTPTTNRYILSSTDYPNDSYKLTLTVSDDLSSTYEERTVHIENSLEKVADNLIRHVRGTADGQVQAGIQNRSQLRSTIYRVTFDRKEDGTTFYNVQDSATGTFLLESDPLPLAPQYGRVFDGLSLTFNNVDFGFDATRSGWSPESTTNLMATVQRENGYAEDLHDYQFRFNNDVADTSVNNITSPFIILDVCHDQKMDFAISELSATQNGQWDISEYIYILRNGTSTDHIVWQVRFTEPNSDQAITPGEGDAYALITNKPFSAFDEYALNSIVLKLDNDPDRMKDFFLGPNYPNPFNPVTNITYRLPLKSRVNLEVFDILGRKVRVLVNGIQTAGRHTVRFSGKELASGIYIYRLQAGEYSRTRRMLLLK